MGPVIATVAIWVLTGLLELAHRRIRRPQVLIALDLLTMWAAALALGLVIGFGWAALLLVLLFCGVLLALKVVV